MKKSVIFLISIIYLISIAVVTFFGTKISIDQYQVYMDNIEITDTSFLEDPQTGKKIKYVEFKFDDKDTGGVASYLINYKYSPDTASHPEAVSFSITNNIVNGEKVADVGDNGIVSFSARRTVRVTIHTTDGSALYDTVIIRCY